MPYKQQWSVPPPTCLANSIKAIDWLAMFGLTAIIVYMVFPVI
jgi:hypothetical protein